MHRGFIAEWTVTIILLLFATTSLVQAFVIPSASMENTLLIGDHVLVDKLVLRAAGRHLASTCCRTATCAAATSSCSAIRWIIKEDYVKRAIGVPGDRIRLVNKQLMLNGHSVNEPYVIHTDRLHRFVPRQFPGRARMPMRPPAIDMLQNHVVNGELVVPPGYIFAMGDNRDDSLDSRYWGFVPRENIVGTPLVIYWSYEAPHRRSDQRQHRHRTTSWT